MLRGVVEMMADPCGVDCIVDAKVVAVIETSLLVCIKSLTFPHF